MTQNYFGRVWKIICWFFVSLKLDVNLVRSPCGGMHEANTIRRCLIIEGFVFPNSDQKVNGANNNRS